MSELGKKFDQEKNRMDLLPWDALEEVAKVLTFGAKKYAPDNWRKVEGAIARYEAALTRHFSAYKQGEQIDADSGLPHIAQVACNALFLVSLVMMDKESGKDAPGHHLDTDDYFLCDSCCRVTFSRKQERCTQCGSQKSASYQMFRLGKIPPDKVTIQRLKQ